MCVEMLKLTANSLAADELELSLLNSGGPRSLGQLCTEEPTTFAEPSRVVPTVTLRPLVYVR